MDVLDPEMAARVWQRVQGTPTLPPEAIEERITEEWTDGVIYLHLSRMFTGREQALLRQMFREEQAHLSCLKGMYVIHNRRSPCRTSPQPPQGTPETILRTCYGREMRGLALYEKWTNDPEYGAVFSRLAACEREHCRAVLELLGSIRF